MYVTREVEKEILSTVDEKGAVAYLLKMHTETLLEDILEAKNLLLELGGDINILFDVPGLITFPRIRDNAENVKVVKKVGIAADHQVDLCLVSNATFMVSDKLMVSEATFMVRKTGNMDTAANELVAYCALGANDDSKYTPKIYGFDVYVEDEGEYDDVEELAHGIIFMEPCMYSVSGMSEATRVDNVDRAVHDLIQAVKYIHSHNILHGDIKPDNVLICYNGSIKLTDFGLSETRMPRIVSMNKYTPGYKPPELYAFEKVYADAAFFDEVRYPLDKKQDMYVLGCTLYFMITGESLFTFGMGDDYFLPLYQANMLNECVAPGHWANQLYQQIEFKQVPFENNLYKTGKYEDKLAEMLDSDPLKRRY